MAAFAPLQRRPNHAAQAPKQASPTTAKRKRRPRSLHAEPKPTLAPLRLSVTPFGTLQRKLTVSKPNDKFEHEADRVAERVMRSPTPDIPAGGSGTPKPAPASPRTTIQRECEECEEERSDRRESISAAATASRILRASASGSNAAASPTRSVEGGIATARTGGGHPMPAALKRFMEPRFGADFGAVRIHHDARADGLSRELGAKAFTVGHDVFFRRGEFQPTTTGGQRLMAHELTHVVQQRGGGAQAVVQRDLVQRDVMQQDVVPGGVVQRQEAPAESVLDDALEELRVPGPVPSFGIGLLESGAFGVTAAGDGFMVGLSARLARQLDPAHVLILAAAAAARFVLRHVEADGKLGSPPSAALATRVVESIVHFVGRKKTELKPEQTAKVAISSQDVDAVQARLGPAYVRIVPEQLSTQRSDALLADVPQDFLNGLLQGTKAAFEGDPTKFEQPGIFDQLQILAGFGQGHIEGVGLGIVELAKQLAAFFTKEFWVELDKALLHFVTEFLDDAELRFDYGFSVGLGVHSQLKELSQLPPGEQGRRVGQLFGKLVVEIAVEVALGALTGGAATAARAALLSARTTLRLRKMSSVARVAARMSQKLDQGLPKQRLRQLLKPEASDVDEAPSVPSTATRRGETNTATRSGVTRTTPERDATRPNSTRQATRDAPEKVAATDGQLVSERPVTVGDEPGHTVQVVRLPDGRHILTLCSPPPCAKLVEELDARLRELPDSDLKTELTELRDGGVELLKRLDAGKATQQQVDAQALRMVAGLGKAKKAKKTQEAARLASGVDVLEGLDPEQVRTFWFSKLGGATGNQLDEAFNKLRKAAPAEAKVRFSALKSLESLMPHVHEIELNDGFRRVIGNLESKDAGVAAGALGEFESARRILESGDLLPGTKFQFSTKAGAELPGGRGRLSDIPEADGLRVAPSGEVVATEAKNNIATFASKLRGGRQFEFMVKWWSRSPDQRRFEVRLAADRGLQKLLDDPAWNAMLDALQVHPELHSKKWFFIGEQATSFNELSELRRLFVAARNAGADGSTLATKFGSLAHARAEAAGGS